MYLGGKGRNAGSEECDGAMIFYKSVQAIFDRMKAMEFLCNFQNVTVFCRRQMVHMKGSVLGVPIISPTSMDDDACESHKTKP